MTRNQPNQRQFFSPLPIFPKAVLPALLSLAAVAAIPVRAQTQAPAPPAHPSAAPPSLTGKWDVHSTVSGNEFHSTCTFTQSDKVLAGTCVSDRGEVKIAGTVDGKNVTWKFDSDYQGAPITLTYTGAFDDKGKLSGSVDVAPFNVTGDFEVSPSDAATATGVAATAPAATAPIPSTVAAPSTSAAITAAGPTASVAGNWHLHSTVSGNDYDSDCVLTQTDKTIAGSCKNEQGEVKITGSVDGPKVTLKIDSEYQGTPINLTYTGAFDAKGKLSGTVDVQPFDVSGDFVMSPAAK
jgi:hypothetical protein